MASPLANLLPSFKTAKTRTLMNKMLNYLGNTLKASNLNSMIFGFAAASALLALFSYTQNIETSPLFVSTIEFLANSAFSVGFYFFVIGHENAKSILKRLSPENTEGDKKPIIYPIFKRSLVAGFAAFISAIILASSLGM